MKVLPHQSLLLRHWRASVSPSSGFEKGLNSLKARRSTSSSSSSHSGEPKVSTAGSELATLEEERQQVSPRRMGKMEGRERNSFYFPDTEPGLQCSPTHREKSLEVATSSSMPQLP